ncbi:alpha/beta fold hydrolase [Flagellimonas flava]|uniref:alpha/beta fold hydrolase n=1 Tax=Flagellimonas flava TaxID=570519 RepID=UPI003D645850
MNYKIKRKSAVLILTILTLGVLSCSKESEDLTALRETIFVRHKNADMPARIFGNASEKVFLIILHGGPGGTGLEYRVNTIRTEVEKNNAVVYFDQRGSGSSQGSYSEKEVSIDLMAEDVLALAKVIKAKYGEDSKLFLMGHSWGGALGPATLLKDQNDFLGWVDVNGAHDPKGLYDNYQIALPEMADEQIALGNSIAYWERLRTLANTIGPYSLQNYYSLNRAANGVAQVLAADDVINEAVADFGNDTPSEKPLTVNWNKNQIGRILDEKGLNENVSFTNRLSEITIPSLVLWGTYDIVVPTLYAQEAFDNLGSDDKEIFIFERSAHSPMYTEPDLFAQKLIEFINTHK